MRSQVTGASPTYPAVRSVSIYSLFCAIVLRLAYSARLLVRSVGAEDKTWGYTFGRCVEVASGLVLIYFILKHMYRAYAS